MHLVPAESKKETTLRRGMETRPARRGGDSSGPKSIVVCDRTPHVACQSRRVNRITTLKLLCCVNRATI